MKKSILFIATFLYALFLNAQPGSLDLSFDVDGIAVTPIDNGDDYGYSVAVQSDGKILVAGYSYNGTDLDISLVRYNSDGSLDNSFDSDGKVITDFVGGSSQIGYAIAIQPDGKILVAGTCFNLVTQSDFCLVRYNSDGSLDNSFDSDGITTTDFGGNDDVGFSVAIQNDGKIVVAGESRIVSYDFAVCRYNSDGSLDSTFSSDGKQTTAMGTGNDDARSVAIQNDGKILVAGEGLYSGTGFDFALLRYNVDGSLDNSFSADGKVNTNFGALYDGGTKVLIQTDGKIIVAGGSDTVFALARYNTNGSLDISFDTDGKVKTSIGSNAVGRSAILQNDGKIVVAGESWNGTDNDFAAARYNSNGSLDNSFDLDGKLTTPIGTGEDLPYSAALQADGKILVAGYSMNSSDSTYDFAIVRYYDGYIGIEEAGMSNSVNVYPNPTYGLITISLDNPLSNACIKLINLTGQSIFMKENFYGSVVTIDITEQSNGLYFLEIMDGSKVSRKKLIKIQ